MTLKNLFYSIREQLDVAWMMGETERLWKLEFGQRSRDQGAAARYAEKLMRFCGLEAVQRLALPADGKTTSQDRIMPLAWTVSHACLTIRQTPLPFPDPVLADYRRHPFHVVFGSVATPRAGLVVPLITEEQLRAGRNVGGAMVMLEPMNRPLSHVYREMCDAGALGLVTDYVVDRHLTPDAISWINGWSEGNHWQVNAGDRPLIGFTVCPRVGDALRAAIRQGKVMVHVVSNARRAEGTSHVVTGLIPGRDKRELWIKAHLYEPLANDNSTGVIGALALARALRELIRAGRLPHPRFSLRLIFAQEVYGFTAYVERRGGYLRPKVLGALNFDSMPLDPTRVCQVWLSPSGSPCCGDYIMEDVVRQCGPLTGISWTIQERGDYFDDLEGADPTVGVSSLWCLQKGALWHNSAQTMEMVHPACFRDTIALQGAWMATMLGLDRKSARLWIARAVFNACKHLMDEVMHLSHASGWTHRNIRLIMGFRLQREEERLNDFRRICPGADIEDALASLRSVQRDLMRGLDSVLPPESSASAGRKADQTADMDARSALSVYVRATRGFPSDLARIPKDLRFAFPDDDLYGPFARVLALLDGRKPLGEVLRRVEWEANMEFSPDQVAAHVQALDRLTEYGYLRRINSKTKRPRTGRTNNV